MRASKRQKLGQATQLRQQGKTPTYEGEDNILVSVRLVCREKHLQGTSHVSTLINSFLNEHYRYSIVFLCNLGLPLLFQRAIAQAELEPANSVRRHPGFRRWCFTQGMDEAVIRGNLEMVMALVREFPENRVPLHVTNHAAARGRLEILKWLFRNCSGVDTCHRDVGAALKGGHFKLAKWLRPKVTRSDINWVTAAAESGSLELVKWAYAKSVNSEKLPWRAVGVAVQRGHLDVLEWLEDRVRTTLNLGQACDQGHFDVVKWALSNHPEQCDNLIRAKHEAAAHGRLDILRLLYGFTISGERVDVSGRGGFGTAMDVAAGNGHLEVVKWLHENQLEGCTRGAMNAAAANGHLDVVKWLHTNRHEGCTSRAADDAAKNGFRDVVMWLLENRVEGCSTKAIDLAASEGRLEMVQWLAGYTSEGCTVDAMDGAASNGHLDVVKWMHENRSEGCTTRAIDGAAKNGHLEMVQWLHTNREEGCTVAAMDEAAKNGHLGVVRLLHNRSEGCTADAVAQAVKLGHFAIALFLYAERTEGDIMDVLRLLPKHHTWGLMDWLYSHHSAEFASAVLERLQASPYWVQLHLEN